MILTCTWYDVPTPDATGEGNVWVAALDCPGDLVKEASCEPTSDGVKMTLTDTDAERELTPDHAGVAAGEVDPGSYDTEVEGGICFADSDAFPDDGALDVGDGPVEVTIYRCGEWLPIHFVFPPTAADPPIARRASPARDCEPSSSSASPILNTYFMHGISVPPRPPA